ncbi:MAG TPA: hypothetical protein VNA28_12615 [Solirubrobacteraceae bacterium]|nr:hypothetical protein [Solirubrobacteraceae bacterium]
MAIRVDEGRLVEFSPPDFSAVQRRAFGEFEGANGELASYALGWTTAADEHAGHFTIGIGIGNPGGGTFHARVFAHEGHHAFGLVDEPFEDVPQGGPHLTAAQARAHEDLPFIWWVADRVMERDRRAWWMRHWLLETRAIQTREVFELQEPILLVVNDADDDLWQLIGSSDAGPDGVIGHLFHAVDEDPTLTEVLDLAPGERAVRTRVGAPWERES